MSYCRWSSMNFRCDLYCYEHCDGYFATHVAGNKVITPIFPDVPFSWCKTWIGRQLWILADRLQHLSLRFGIRRDIELPHAGESFASSTLEEFKELLIHLRGLGYRFPDYVLEAIDQEIADARKFSEATA